MERPETTLFMLMSVDGKISTGDNDDMDVDRDFPTITGVKEGLNQYYELEQETDSVSLNTGRVLAKIGVNEKVPFQEGVPATFVVVDSKPHLTADGVDHLAEKTKGLYVISSNKNHPARELADQNEEIRFLLYPDGIDFDDALKKLREFGVEKITIQSGGTLNATLLRGGLIDHLSVVVAPALVGGRDTPTLVDGESLHTAAELTNIRPLKLVSSEQLEHSYLHLRYDVLND